MLGLKIFQIMIFQKAFTNYLMNFSIEEKHPGFIRHSEGRLSRRITSEVIKVIRKWK